MATNEEEIVIKYEEGHLEDPLERARPAHFNHNQTQQNELIDEENDDDDKINIAFNILQACKEMSASNVSREIPAALEDKLKYFTKLPLYDPVVFEVLNEKYEDRSLKQALLETNALSIFALRFIYSDIRDAFIEFFIKKKQIPTITDLMTTLNDIRDNNFYKQVKFRTLVNNKLVDYHHLPTLHRYIITENPRLAYQRHLYLRQIIGYRSQGKPIVYVSVLKLITNKYLVLAFSSTAGLIAKSDCMSDAKAGDETGSGYVRSWIQSELLPVLSPRAVVVLMQPRREITTPTASSRKQTIVKWLQDREIPCDVDSHKSQLYKLFKIYQKKYKEHGFYENIFASNGMTVVVCRNEYPQLVYLHDICLDISNTAGNLSFNINKMLKEIPRGQWMMMEYKVIREEKQMMKDDEEMATIIENLLEMVKNGDIQAADFPDGCIGTKADNFYIHIGDILID